MLEIGAFAVASLWVLCHVQPAQTQGFNVNTRHEVGSSPPEQPTCPARSVNYITERLPQQCLKSPWSSSSNDATPSIASSSGAGTPATSGEPTVTDSEIIALTATISSQSSGARVSHGPASIVSISGTPTSTSATSPYSAVASETSQDPGSAQRVETDTEGESPLDNANFLSFEEWKNQNLAKAGQSADHIGGGRTGTGHDGSRRRPANINNALDSLGEESELEIDFGGFVNPDSITRLTPSEEVERKHQSAARAGKKHDQDLPNSHPRGRDAGKTCKERSNYASFDCAATIMKTNKESKGSTSILVENKDSYMLNECSAKNKFFIVELCDDILIDTVVLANFEFFSSSFRGFRVSVSDRYPVKPDKWKDLGAFEARNSREVQAFLIETPQIWARYVRIEFLSHYGNEYYCPVSLFRVHGTTMMEEFNHDLKASRGEDDTENEMEAVDEEIEKSQDIVTAVNMMDEAPAPSQERPVVSSSTSAPSNVSAPPLSTIEKSQVNESARESSATGFTATNSLLQTQLELFFMSNGTHDVICHIHDVPSESALQSSTAVETSRHNFNDNMREDSTEQAVSTSYPELAQTRSSQNISSSSISPSPTGSTTRLNTITGSLPSLHHTSQGPHDGPPGSSSPPSSSRATSSATQPPSSNPTTQESFFKSVHKRLQLLESNSTLSLQYIEEQSRILRDAFSKVEKRQLAKASTFLETLNLTVLTELRDFRSQYDQLWQSTVLELSSQRAQSQQEILALSARLSLLADEVVLQRRIAIMQFLLIVVCLGLVLFGRSHSSVATYLELPPMVQNAINKSSANLSRYSPVYDSPNRTPSPTRPSSRYGFFRRASPMHFREPSDDSRLSPSEASSRLTPE